MTVTSDREAYQFRIADLPIPAGPAIAKADPAPSRAATSKLSIRRHTSSRPRSTTRGYSSVTARRQQPTSTRSPPTAPGRRIPTTLADNSSSTLFATDLRAGGRPLQLQWSPQAILHLPARSGAHLRAQPSGSRCRQAPDLQGVRGYAISSTRAHGPVNDCTGSLRGHIPPQIRSMLHAYCINRPQVSSSNCVYP